MVAYKRTPVFTAATLPDGLKRDHATKAGVWGLIHVEAGRLQLEIAQSGAVIEIGPGETTGILAPEERHRVRPVRPVRPMRPVRTVRPVQPPAAGDDRADAADGGLRFYVEFYRQPEPDDDR